MQGRRELIEIYCYAQVRFRHIGARLTPAAGGKELRRWTSYPGLVERALLAMEGRSSAAGSVAALAADLGVHPDYLSRLLVHRCGISFRIYRIFLRVERAAQAILSSEESLARIAIDAGFADQSHLTRVLRRIAGVTPGELRRRRSPMGVPLLELMARYLWLPQPEAPLPAVQAARAHLASGLASTGA